VVSAAWPDERPIDPRIVPPSRNVTIPLGETPLTVVTKVTGCPAIAERDGAGSVVVVGDGPTVAMRFPPK
jgi:hypothetical protein